MKLSTIDIFRKIPADLSHGTKIGGVLSVCCIGLMVVLSLLETAAFLRGDTSASIVLDTLNNNEKVRVSFHITALDLPCQFASVNVWDYMGTNEIDVETNIVKTVVTGDNGQITKSRHVDSEREIQHDSYPSSPNPIDHYELDHLSSEDFKPVLSKTAISFVNFYAPWCVWCQRLAPTWEAFGKRVRSERLPIRILAVDCVANADTCRAQNIKGYPTLRIFKSDVAQAPDYHSDRTINGLMTFVKEQTSGLQGNTPESHNVRQHSREGCAISGFLDVNRVPGKFVITAKSGVHDFDPAMANASHIIHQLRFGPPYSKHFHSLAPQKMKDNIEPLNDRTFVTDSAHTTMVHYLKVVSTHLADREIYYQMTASNHIFKSEGSDTNSFPSATFSYDLSPVAVLIERDGRTWYEFLIHMSAIIGGLYTLMGILDRSFHAVAKKVTKNRDGKLN